MFFQTEKRRVFIFLASAVFFTAFLLRAAGYIYFHTFVESITILLAVNIFYYILKHHVILSSAFFVIFGAGFFCVGLVDIFHALTYDGMGIFYINEANAATQFWIAGRLIMAGTFLCAILTSGLKVRILPVLAIYTLLFAGSVSLIFSGLFPDALLPDVGLTQFKIYSEYVVIGILFLSLVNIYRLRDNFEFSDHIILSSAIGIMILSEYCFTLYNDVYGVMNFIGHIFKLIAYILVSIVFFNSIKRNTFGNIHD